MFKPGHFLFYGTHNYVIGTMNDYKYWQYGTNAVEAY
jgi:hypothetical protein